MAPVALQIDRTAVCTQERSHILRCTDFSPEPMDPWVLVSLKIGRSRAARAACRQQRQQRHQRSGGASHSSQGPHALVDSGFHAAASSHAIAARSSLARAARRQRTLIARRPRPWLRPGGLESSKVPRRGLALAPLPLRGCHTTAARIEKAAAGCYAAAVCGSGQWRPSGFLTSRTPQAVADTSQPVQVPTRSVSCAGTLQRPSNSWNPLYVVTRTQCRRGPLATQADRWRAGGLPVRSTLWL
eukprot:COSAG01_NODE_142_length_24198_cov_8.924893_6_plen_243_part_00